MALGVAALGLGLPCWDRRAGSALCLGHGLGFSTVFAVSPCGWAGPRVRFSRCLRVAPALRGLLRSVLCLPSAARLAACCRLLLRSPLGRGPWRLAFGVFRQRGQYSTGHTDLSSPFCKNFFGVARYSPTGSKKVFFEPFGAVQAPARREIGSSSGPGGPGEAVRNDPALCAHVIPHSAGRGAAAWAAGPGSVKMHNGGIIGGIYVDSYKR